MVELRRISYLWMTEGFCRGELYLRSFPSRKQLEHLSSPEHRTLRCLHSLQVCDLRRIRRAADSCCTSLISESSLIVPGRAIFGYGGELEADGLNPDELVTVWWRLGLNLTAVWKFSSEGGSTWRMLIRHMP